MVGEGGEPDAEDGFSNADPVDPEEALAAMTRAVRTLRGQLARLMPHHDALFESEAGNVPADGRE